jgi:hypothetical protein
MPLTDAKRAGLTRARENIIDSSSPAEIAGSIVRVNKALDLRHPGLNALWKLYYAPRHTLLRAELEKEFGVLEDHFGVYCRRVAEELGAKGPDALPLVTISLGEDGLELITLKSPVVMAIKSYAFSKLRS